jgi:hypothetical protein
MELSLFWEAASCVATQELPSILRNAKVHYRVHKSPPLVPILNQINPTHIIPSYLRSILILAVHLRLDFPSGLFPSAFLFSPFVFNAQPISSFLTWSFYLYLEKSTSYEAPHYAAFSNLLSLHLSFSLVQIFSTPCSQTPSIYVFPLILETRFQTHTDNFTFYKIPSSSSLSFCRNDIVN